MSRSSFNSPQFDPSSSPAPDESPVPAAQKFREPSLVRLVQSIVEYDPVLARHLCRSGLATIADPAARQAWAARLAPLLDDDTGDNQPSLTA